MIEERVRDSTIFRYLSIDVFHQLLQTTANFAVPGIGYARESAHVHMILVDMLGTLAWVIKRG